MDVAGVDGNFSPGGAKRAAMHGRWRGSRAILRFTTSSLELLFDLTFVTCFAFAAAQLAHAFTADHYSTALIEFGFASLCICWAWFNFTWCRTNQSYL